MTVNRGRSREGWVFSVRVPPGRAEQFAALTDGQMLAVLPGTTKRDVVEATMIALVQSVVLVDDDDRFDYVTKTAPYMPEGNPVHRHFELDAGGATIVASKSSVRLFNGKLQWEPKPWLDGMTAQSFEAAQRDRGRR